MIVKKMIRYTNVYLIQSLMPPLLVPEHKYGKRFNTFSLGESSLVSRTIKQISDSNYPATTVLKTAHRPSNSFLRNRLPLNRIWEYLAR